MHPGPRPAAFTLTADEKAELERRVRRHHGSQALVLRARIILACAQPGPTNRRVGRELAVCRPSFIERRTRFGTRRLTGLSDVPRPGAPRTVEDEGVERLARRTARSDWRR